MLRELEVRDLGIIERVRLELPPGFVVLTGETGAGKSLLVHSLKLLSGERGDTDMLRSGAQRLFVEGCFAPIPESCRPILEEVGVDPGDELVVRREMTAAGRSRAWLNDVPVALHTLGRLAPHLLHIAGQHEQRDLADPTTHLSLVDAFGGLQGLAREVAACYTQWRASATQLAEARKRLAERRDRLDLLNFQIQELTGARLQPGEREALLEERALLRHGERIGELVTQARLALGGDAGITQLARAARAVRELGALGVGVGDAQEHLHQAQLLTEEALRLLDGLADRVQVNPQRLEEVEARLAQVERLARKYGGSVEAALEYLANVQEEKATLEGVEERIAVQEAEEEAFRRLYLEKAAALKAARERASLLFAKAVEEVLGRLAMAGSRVALQQRWRLSDQGNVTWEGRRLDAAPWGLADGELYISPNPGEELRPLAKIASGGELSRIHLAVRSILRQGEDRELPKTLLFDEVDSGIGGRVAEEVGRLLWELGRRDQVLVVTHLPQVASLGDSHFVVAKATRQGRTVTTVTQVEGEERVLELVRMLGAEGTSTAARQHALELLARRP
ncbi:MAG: DNA repair protein RecN [Thermoanaerobaculaceae bacterium]